MKLLNDEQQTELQDLLEKLAEHQIPIGLSNQLNFWRLELKPKRKKRVKTEKSVDTQSE